MGIRAEKKERTRQGIIQAALKLSSEQGFACLSLREVTREAGIAPTSFYRHFKDMDELGLVLVEEISAILRQLVRNARQRLRVHKSAVRSSLETFMEYLEKNEEHFRLLVEERFPPTRANQVEIRWEMDRFITELAEDLSKETEAHNRPNIDNRLAAEMMIETAFHTGVSSLYKDGSINKGQVLEQLVAKTNIILLGSEAIVQGWQSGRATPLPRFRENTTRVEVESPNFPVESPSILS